jgi:hypothetical protein
MGAAAMACVLGLVARSGADVLELKNGSVLAGKYAGGTTGTIRFETGGSVRALAVSEVLALTLTGAPAPVAVPEPAPAVTAPAPAQAAPAVELAPGTVVVAAGTAMMVRMVDGVSSKSPQGKRFATVLETDLVVGNVMVAKAGTKVYGRVEKAGQAGRLAGKSVLDLRLCELTVGGKLVPIVTGPCALAGARSIGKTAKGALAGAAIGSFSGDSGKGAAIGALASGLKPGQPIVVPPGTLLEFDIQQAVTVNLIR